MFTYGDDEILTSIEEHIWKLATARERTENVTVQSRREWVHEKIRHMAREVGDRSPATYGSYMQRATGFTPTRRAVQN
jgi:hypothetical protein